MTTCPLHPDCTEVDKFSRCLECVRVVQDILRARVAAMGPCSTCGDEDRTPTGRCRPCAAERKRRQRERERRHAQRIEPIVRELADLGARVLERIEGK